MRPCEGLPSFGRAEAEGRGDLGDPIQREPCLVPQPCQPSLMLAV